jgi:nitroimidazol reductase NimA-like FMN-containing flavoprotein (pyridoxamine 5'-phosphate oxidase superfamily)
MPYKMTKEEREAFLADLHVGIIGINNQGRGPLMLPIWYSYTPGGEIKFVTTKDSWKARRLKVEMRFSLCVQNEEPPYQYVSVKGGSHRSKMQTTSAICCRSQSAISEKKRVKNMQKKHRTMKKL